MKTKEIDGVLYKLVPEEKEESCKGCAFKDSDGATCTIFSKDCNEGLIYKKVDEPISTLNLKPFNLKEAKAGKPVCTRNGRKARIICFDRNAARYNIVALVDCSGFPNKEDAVKVYTNDGRSFTDGEAPDDLMMVSEKHEGWVNVYKSSNGKRSTGALYPTKEVALSKADITDDDYISTAKIEWEE